jgi:hypothetical protein
MQKDLHNLPPDLGAPNLLKRATTEDGQTLTFFNSDDIKFDKDDPITKLNLTRLEMERSIRRRMEAVLTDEQRAQCRQKPIQQVLFGADQVFGL